MYIDFLVHVIVVSLTLPQSEDSPNNMEWAMHVCNAKKAANHVYASDRVSEGDVRTLLEWIFYHDALSRFGTSHWAHRTAGMEQCVRDDRVRRAVQVCGESSKVFLFRSCERFVANVMKIMTMVGCSAEVLEAITSLCDYAHISPTEDANESLEAIDRLERKLRNAQQFVSRQEKQNDLGPEKGAVQLAELYRLSGLIYLYRACKKLSSSSPEVSDVVERSYVVLSNMDTGDRSFPLMVIGCEAQRDDQRLMVLNLLGRTHESHKFASLTFVQKFVEASWARDDLAFPKELDYVRKFDSIMSSHKVLPSLA